MSRAELASESLSWGKLPFGVSAVAQAFYTQPLSPGVLRLLPSSVYLWIFFAASCWGAKLITQVTPPDRAESLGQKSRYGGLCGCPGEGRGELAGLPATGLPGGEPAPAPAPQPPEWRNLSDPVNVSFN